MTQEGKFKSEMRKDFFLSLEPENGTAIRVWDVFKLLDEAKKDLLKDSIQGPYISEIGMQVIIIEKTKFEKWFGSEQP